MDFRVRPTAVLIEDDKILLVRQQISELKGRKWSLPGGGLETGESLEACVIREFKEETGLDVVVERLLYVCERIQGEVHVLHITFAVNRTGGRLQVGIEPEPDANPITDVQMVPLSALEAHGFSQRFCELAVAGFPESGTYQGSVANIGW